MRLLIHPPVDKTRLGKIRAVDTRLEVVNAADDSEAMEAMPGADCFFGKMTPELLELASNLKWIQAPTASMEHYIFPELSEHPVVLTNMRGLFSDIIADQVMGYVLCFSRQLHVYIRQQTNAHWAPVGGEESRADFRSGPGVVSPIDLAHQPLSGKIMGIMGLGEIGQELARRASAFGIQVIAVDPNPAHKIPEVRSLRSPQELADMLRVSDFVVIAAPHTPETQGLFDREMLAQMRKEAYLINIGRGAILQLDALVESLEQHRIAGAALDVFEVEPLPQSHPLWRCENVIITPHVAGYGPDVAPRHLAVLLDNLQRFMNDKPLNNIVNKTLWY